MANGRRFRVKIIDVLNRDRAATALLSIFITLPFLYNACQKSDHLVPLTQVSLQSVQTQNVQLNFCTPPSVPQQMYLKTLIILDHSGSNATNYKMAANGSGAPDMSTGLIQILTSLATDPMGITRYGTPNSPGTLLNYLKNLPPNDPKNPTNYFALIDFNGAINNVTPGFTADIPTFYNTVLADSGQSVTPAVAPANDSGSTDYIGALGNAQAMIQADITQAKNCAAKSTSSAPTTACPHPGVIVPSAYVIVFMSDGSPILQITFDNSTTPPTPIVDSESTTTILSDVINLVDLQNNNAYVAAVNLFTIYYYVPGNVDVNGQTLLSNMAKDGNGVFYNATSGSQINYSQFVPPTKLVQYSMTDLFITNASGVWWNGQFLADTDGDGLPDVIETAWGSNPNNAHSFNNGLSDLVNYQNALYQASLPAAQQCANGISSVGSNGAIICQYKTTLCSGVGAGVPMYKSSDPDGLNDCEKIVLNDAAGVNNPDSNADSIPDWLEFLNGVPFQSGTAPAVATPQQDGYSIYETIKYSMPVQVPLNTAINLNPSVYNVNLLSQSLSQSCYSVYVTGLPVLSSTDKIRVDMTLKSNLSTNNVLYKRGIKKFATGSKQLIINDWTNPAEITAGTWSVWP